MGRHAAAPTTTLHRPDFDRRLEPAPITDPRLFDRPLVAVAPATSAHRRQELEPRWQDLDELPVDDRLPVAAGLAPRPVRTALRADETTVMPRIAGPSILAGGGASFRREPAPGSPAPVDPKPTGGLGAFVRSREAALAAAAVAVVGAVSGAAAILPTNNPEAKAEGTLTSPVPLPSGSTASDGQVCFSRTEIVRAMRHHHHRRTAAAPTGAASGVPSNRSQAPVRDLPKHTIRPSSSTKPRSGSSTSTGAATGGGSSSGAAAVVTSGLDIKGIISGAARGALLGLNTGTYVMKDFDSQLMGANLGTGGIKGAGVDKTVIAMASNTSTKAGSVPTADYSTNQLYLLSTIGGTPGLSGFTLQGTQQGHLYNGLRIGQASNARVSDVKITDIPGNKSFPPGETFALNDWRTDGSVYNNISIDGGGTSAVDFGSNSSTNITVNDSTFTGTAYSSGMAMWQTKNITLNDVTIKDNRSGINFERASGKITLNRPKFSGNRLYDMQFGTDQEGGDVVINDPVLAAGQKLKINAPLQYHGGANGQKRANIHVYVNGVDKTSELVQFL